MRSFTRLILLTGLVSLLPLTAAAQLDVDAGKDVTLECESDDGTEYTLNGSVPDGDSIEFDWTTVPHVDLDEIDTLTPTGTFPLGDTTVTLDAEDTDSDETGSDDVVITVEDSTAPVVKAHAVPFVLWPPNHEMHEIEVEIKIRDRCADRDDFHVELISAESNEPDNGKGDGNTNNDIQGASLGEDDREVRLRAERSGKGNGRVYTLTYLITDGSGNETEAEAKVYVPHDYSDVKDHLGDMGGDRDDMGPICPTPDEAAEEFVDATPDLGIYPDQKSCQRACKVWAKGCVGIVKGSARCVKSEAKSLLRLDLDECRTYDDRDDARECKQEVKDAAERIKKHLVDATQDGADTCESIGRRCSNACADLHDENGSDFDDEGVDPR